MVNQKQYFSRSKLQMWADTPSSLILMKTTDKSLHLINTQTKTKVWTRPYGLSSLIKLVLNKDKYIVLIVDIIVQALSKYSAVYALESATGAISWQRSAIGRIGDIHLIEHKEGANVALVIDSMDTKKTRVAE